MQLIKIEYRWQVAPITHSMCMWVLAIWRVSSISFGDSWSRPRVNAGIFSDVCILATSSPILNPQSVSTVSPGSNLFRKPLFRVKCLSLTLPPHDFEIKVVKPRGHIAMNTFAVFACLYCWPCRQFCNQIGWSFYFDFIAIDYCHYFYSITCSKTIWHSFP